LSADADSYRKIINLFKEQNIEKHTYQLKENRKYRVVIKNLYYNVDKEKLKEELEYNGFQVCNIKKIPFKKR